MFQWKNLFKAGLFALIVSVVSSTTTWYLVSHQSSKELSWKEILNLNPAQEKEFSRSEADLNVLLNEMSVEDSQNKIAMCAHLSKENMSPEEAKQATQKAVSSYEQKQEKIASLLARISINLTPDQKKKFTSRLMHEICVSCRQTTGEEKCLCGMCAGGS